MAEGPMGGWEQARELALPCGTPDSQALTLAPAPLPQGLIGPRMEVPVTLNGKHCLAVLDNGSQVMILVESFYKKKSHPPNATLAY